MRDAVHERVIQAQQFLDLLRDEGIFDPDRHAARSEQVYRSITACGSYVMDFVELEHACRVAWRNNDRCIGRLPWRTLTVRDHRSARTAEEVFGACVEHLRQANHQGQLQPLITVFRPVEPEPDAGASPPIRIWNPQLIRYAGWTLSDGRVLGDPLHVELTAAIEGLGWRARSRTHFTVLPVVVHIGEERPRLFELPTDAVLEVPIVHPEHPWFAELGLKWHAVPMLSSMALVAGGLTYSAAPFSGWYMGTEIGARNFGDSDRYNLLPVVAAALGLDTGRPSTLWQDRALVELNIAVLHSFRRAGVRIVDHHSASHQFMTHIAREEASGREACGDWSWLVPPLSGSTTPVFHRYYPTAELAPRFVEQGQPWVGHTATWATSGGRAARREGVTFVGELDAATVIGSAALLDQDQSDSRSPAG